MFEPHGNHWGNVIILECINNFSVWVIRITNLEVKLRF